MPRSNDKRIRLSVVTAFALLVNAAGCSRQDPPTVAQANSHPAGAAIIASEHVQAKPLQVSLSKTFVTAIQAFSRQDNLIVRPVLAKRVGADTLQELDAHSDATVETLRIELEKLLTAASVKHSKLAERQYQQLKMKRAVQPPTTRLNFGVSVLAKVIDSLLPSANAKPVVTTVETETAQVTTTTDSITVEDDVATTTQTVNGEAKVEATNNSVSINSVLVSVVDSVAKQDPSSRVAMTTRNSQKVNLDLCPNANGQLHGHATAKLSEQTVATQQSTSVTLTRDTTLQFEITAFVNDDAVMTHFDMTGSGSTTVAGAADPAMNGAVSRNLTMNGNTPLPQGTFADAIVSQPTSATNAALSQYNDAALALGRLALEPFLKSAIGLALNVVNGGHCVAVEFGPAASPFYSLASMNIQATGVSKLSGEKIDSKIEATGDARVAPDVQAAKPTATITWIAPESGTAFIIATSISKRGQGSEMLRIPVEPKPLPAGVVCDEPWVGTISAQNSKRAEEEMLANGELTSHTRTKEVTRILQAKLAGSRDTSNGISNNFRASGRFYDAVSTIEIHQYKDRVIQCPTVTHYPSEKQTRTRTRQADETLPILIAISVMGGNGFFQIEGPNIGAQKHSSQIYETGCESYDEINSIVEPNESDGEIKTMDYELEFAAPDNDNAAKGSKTVTESDGSLTKYDWDIKRCGGAPNR